jgi:hypothetical protein
VHYVTLYTWENDRRPERPSEASLARVARVYGTQVGALGEGVANGEAPPSPSSAPAGGGAAGGARRSHATRVATPSPMDALQSAIGAAPDDLAERPAADTRASTTIMRADAPGGASGAPLSRRVYGHVFRLLADLAEQTDLGSSELDAAREALTSPALFRVFVPFAPDPDGMSEDDVIAAVDAASVAVRSFVASRRQARTGRGARHSA